jgi:ATP-dependent Lon protease
MEIIRIPGYTEDEKVEIAKRHLIPKEMTAHGLKDEEWKITDAGLRDLIRYYTREAGVRSLERELGNLARKTVRDLGRETVVSITIDEERLGKYAGVKKYRYGETDEEDQVGIITGLAYTDFGGDILTIEAVKMPGKGRMSITGNLKDVMKESIAAANSYVRSRATRFGLEPPSFERTDVHIHVPDGATPKDGPSAGAAMATAIVSVLTGIPIKADIAMTGEVTLRGRVTAIGGLKEKLLAAMRSGVKTVLIPVENEKDLADIPDNVKSAMEIIPVSTMDQVLSHALTRQPVAIEWSEKDQPVAVAPDEGDIESVITH